MFDDYATNVKSAQENEYSVLVIQQQPVQFATPERPRRSCCRLTVIFLMVVLVNLALAASVWWFISLNTSATSPNTSTNPITPNSPQCITPFGAQLGLPTSTGIAAFSNCYPEFQSLETNLIQTQQMQAVQTGYKWQSVEYASRSLVVLQQVIIPTVQSPAGVWQLSSLPSITGTSSSAFVSFTNGNTFTTNGNSKPAVGDIVVYPSQSGLPQGHVAVVVGVADEYVFIAEQNWQNTPWTHVEYSRALQLSIVTPGGSSVSANSVNQAGSSANSVSSQDSSGSNPVEYAFQLTDPAGFQIYGWKRVQSSLSYV